MYIAEWHDGEWRKGELKPYGPLQMMPSAQVGAADARRASGSGRRASSGGSSSSSSGGRWQREGLYAARQPFQRSPTAPPLGPELRPGRV
jgi:hypothetical protein